MLEHGFHVGGTDRGRLLQPHVEAGVQRLAGKLGMLPWGHAQEHGIELLVAIHLGSVAVAALYAVLVGGAPSQLQVPIAERREPHRQVVQRGQNNSSGYSCRGLYQVVAGNVPDAAGMIHQFPPTRASGAAAPTGRSSRTDRRADLRRWLGPGGAGRSQAGRRPGAPRRLRLLQRRRRPRRPGGRRDGGAAFVEPDLERLLDTALTFIPADSTIARLIGDVREWHAAAGAAGPVGELDSP